jgi:hypothetical protein
MGQQQLEATSGLGGAGSDGTDSFLFPPCVHRSVIFAVCSVGWRLMAGAGLF